MYAYLIWFWRLLHWLVMIGFGFGFGFRTGWFFFLCFNNIIALDWDATVHIRWKSVDALKWYFNPGNKRTKHAIKIRKGPSLGLVAAKSKPKTITTWQHLNHLYAFQTKISFHKSALLFCKDNPDAEKDLLHQSGDASSVKKKLTHEGENRSAWNNKSV
eukprot:195626_1